MKLDPYTYGNSAAAVVLVEKLNAYNDARLTKRISKFIAHNYLMIKALEEMPDRACRQGFASMLRERINEYGDGDRDTPDIVLSLSKNILIKALKTKITRPDELYREDFDYDQNYDLRLDFYFDQLDEDMADDTRI